MQKTEIENSNQLATTRVKIDSTKTLAIKNI